MELVRTYFLINERISILEKHILIQTPNYNENSFKTTSVNQKWTTDVSEFKTAMSKLYLSPILDMHSRKIVGYDISTTPSLFQTYRMLDLAFSKFFHSNQGWQYQHFSY